MSNQIIRNDVNSNNGINKLMPSNEQAPINNNINQKENNLNQSNNSHNSNNNSNNTTNIGQYGLIPINTKCRFCKKNIKTIVNKECVWRPICLSIWTSGIWWCYQKCQKKEVNCYNIRHSCSNCGNLLN